MQMAPLYAFPEQDAGNMPLFHPQNIIKPSLTGTALHQKAIGIKQKDRRKNRQNDRAEKHNHFKMLGAGHLGYCRIGVDRNGIVKTRHGKNTGQDIGNIESAVFADILQGKPAIKAFTHLPHPASASSAYQRCAQRAPHRWPHPGKADETPFRRG